MIAYVRCSKVLEFYADYKVISRLCVYPLSIKVLGFSTDLNAYLGSILGSSLITRELTLSSHLLLGESVVCQKPGEQRHRGNT